MTDVSCLQTSTHYHIIAVNTAHATQPLLYGYNQNTARQSAPQKHSSPSRIRQHLKKIASPSRKSAKQSDKSAAHETTWGLLATKPRLSTLLFLLVMKYAILPMDIYRINTPFSLTSYTVKFLLVIPPINLCAFTLFHTYRRQLFLRITAATSFSPQHNRGVFELRTSQKLIP